MRAHEDLGLFLPETPLTAGTLQSVVMCTAAEAMMVRSDGDCMRTQSWLEGTAFFIVSLVLCPDSIIIALFILCPGLPNLKARNFNQSFVLRLFTISPMSLKSVDNISTSHRSR